VAIYLFASGTGEGDLGVGNAVSCILTLNGDATGLCIDVMETIGSRDDEAVGNGSEWNVGLHTSECTTGNREVRGVHIANEFMQRNSDDAFA